jgi:CRISPR-associated protein Cmr3
MVEYRKITPVDVLFLRGNRLFGGAGEHGESQMPPWPSVFFGAMASRILADKGKIGDITKSPDKAQAILNEVAGENYGCTFLSLAGKGKTYLPLPYDLVALQDEGGISLHPVNPCPLPGELRSSNTLPMVPILKTPERKKPIGGIWLDLEGWKRHLAGKIANNSFCVNQGELWKVDSRLGIARDYSSKTAAEGKIYTTEGVVMREDSSFLVGFDGLNIPKDGLLRLGGDGRGAVIEPCNGVEMPGDLGKPEDDWAGFRMILITPGVFPKGWLPPGCEKDKDGKIVLHFNGLKAELKAVTMKSHEVISGWDLANHEPKPARKVVPAGSVYWFECVEGSLGALEAIWRNSLYVTLGNGIDTEFKIRKREGFGRVWFGKWVKSKEV